MSITRYGSQTPQKMNARDWKRGWWCQESRQKYKEREMAVLRQTWLSFGILLCRSGMGRQINKTVEGKIRPQSATQPKRELQCLKEKDSKMLNRTEVKERVQSEEC